MPLCPLRVDFHGVFGAILVLFGGGLIPGGSGGGRGGVGVGAVTA